jgi:quercetin dioxygenase-like cupin family protein
MKKMLLVLGIAALGLAAHAQADGAAQLVGPADAKWSPVPNMQGLQMAVLDGDPAKGPSHFLIKFTGGFSAPLHHHTTDHYVTVVAGTLVLGVDGKEKKLPAGSFFSFSGMKPHTTRCEAGAECLLSIDARGAWDVVPEEAAAPAKK